MQIKYHYFEVLNICKEIIKTMEKLFFIMSNLQTNYHFKLDFQKFNQHTGGNWLIHRVKHHKDNQLQSLELSCRIS